MNFSQLYNTVIALGYCQNFISAQYMYMYLVNELMEFHQNNEKVIGWESYASVFRNLQQSYGP